MAWTFILVAGTSTLNLNDGTNYQVLVNGFHAPPPQVLTSYAGPNLFRHGADLIERSYGNRTVTIGLEIKGTNASTLGAQVQNIWDYLRRAEEFSKDGLGTQVQLRYQWEGATGTYLFDVIEGRLDLGANLHSAYLLKGTRARNAQLVLEAKPFVTQPSETAMNFLKDPSFEVAATPLADWVSTTATGTITRVATASKYGTAAAKFVRTGGVQTQFLDQAITTGFTAGDTVSFAVWQKLVAGTSDIGMALSITFRNSAGAALSSATAISTAIATSYSQISVTNQTVPTDAGTGTITYSLRMVGSTTGSGTGLMDGGYAGKGSSLPAAWVSGRDVANHYDDNGQAHINYLDIFDVPGDVPAPIQVKVLESEAHDAVWVGARHDTRMTGTGLILEGENFTATIGGPWTSTGNGLFSSGSGGRYSGNADAFPSMTATTPSAPQVVMQNIGVPPVGQFRVLVAADVNAYAAGGTAYIGMGYQYGSRTVDPSATAEYSTFTGTHLRLVDLGVITIPPFKTPNNATLGTLGVRLAFYVTSATKTSPEIDYVLLMPINEGGVYGSKTSAADNLWVDSVSSPVGIYRVTTADVAQSFPPAQVGSPPLVHPKGSRLYFQFGSATGSIGHGAIVSVSYTPRWLHVGT